MATTLASLGNMTILPCRRPGASHFVAHALPCPLSRHRLDPGGFSTV